jgi:hypothetical protein
MFPAILSEIAGGPKLFSHGLNRMACMRRVRTRQRSLGSNERFEPCLPFVCAPVRRKSGGVAKGGRTLERRSGDPEMESPAGKKATGRDPANGKAVNWR